MHSKTIKYERNLRLPVRIHTLVNLIQVKFDSIQQGHTTLGTTAFASQAINKTLTNEMTVKMFPTTFCSSEKQEQL